MYAGLAHAFHAQIKLQGCIASRGTATGRPNVNAKGCLNTVSTLCSCRAAQSRTCVKLPQNLALQGDCPASLCMRFSLLLVLVLMQIACSRCGATQDLSADVSHLGQGNRTPSHSTLELSCSNCHQPWRIEVAPRLVHAASNVLARLRPLGCNPIDLLPSLLAGQCGSCSSIAAFRYAFVSWK